MIRLTRPKAPASLIKTSATGTALLWKAWQRGKPLKIKPSIYGSAPVKKALLKAQNHKCAYCETRFVRDYGQVEHYRPKAGWKQMRSDEFQRPGYFWLAYEWTNLLVSCAMCNDAGHKANLFPLIDPSLRATAQIADVSAENPLLLNPFDDHPETHIAWNADVPRPINGCNRGQTTIEAFALANDEKLVDERRGHLHLIKITLEAAESGSLSVSKQAEHIAVLGNSLQDSAPYAAMISANFKTRILALEE